MSRPEPTDWVTFQGNPAHTGDNPVLVNVADISLKWEKIVNPDEDDGLGKYGLEQVTAADGKIFVTDDAYVWYGAQFFVLDEADGSELWSKTFDDGRRANPAAYLDGKVYVSTNDEFGSYYDRWYWSFMHGFDPQL